MMRWWRCSNLIAILMLPFLAACGSDAGDGGSGSGGDGGGSGGGSQPTGRFKWTLIIFMNADNDLEAFGVEDVNEMERLANSDDVAIVVLMDRTRGFDTSNGNWTTTRRFRIRNDNNPNIMTSALTPAEGGSAEDLGELDTGSAETLRDFILWAQTNYPADHYLVDLWNHGAGWRKRSGENQHPLARGVLFDDTQGTWVETTELNGALTVGSKIDIVAFDSSLMQMMEVAYQIQGQCDLVVGSQESPPGQGYPYHVIFEPVIANPDITPTAFAQHIVNSTIATLGPTNYVTQSALITSQLPALRNAISGFADALASRDGAFHDAIAGARTSAQRYGGGSSLYEGNRDLLDFVRLCVQRTGNDPTIASAGQAVEQALTNALAAEAHAGSLVANSNGVAIFIPNRTDWVDLRGRYRQLGFAADSTWDEWLDLFHRL